MALSVGRNIAVTGAGNQDTGLRILTGVNIACSAGTTISLRKTSGAGTIVAQAVLAAAGNWTPQIPSEGLYCDSGNWFVESTAGNLTGGVFGRTEH